MTKPILEQEKTGWLRSTSKRPQHTPGPWRAEVDSTGDGYYFIETADERGDIICRINRVTETGDDEWANARLIAAAPELLKIAEEIANSRCDLGDSERRIRLYSAIRKAGGEL